MKFLTATTSRDQIRAKHIQNVWDAALLNTSSVKKVITEALAPELVKVTFAVRLNAGGRHKSLKVPEFRFQRLASDPRYTEFNGGFNEATERILASKRYITNRKKWISYDLLNRAPFDLRVGLV